MSRAMSWMQFALGLLVLISPWALGMGGTVIMWTNALLGALLMLMGLWNMFVKKL